jgi:hypothetical protein
MMQMATQEGPTIEAQGSVFIRATRGSSSFLLFTFYLFLHLLRDASYPLAQAPRSVKLLVAYTWIERPGDGGRSGFAPDAPRLFVMI